MKLHSAILGVFFCLAAQAAGTPYQDAPANPPAPKAQQSMTGCVDEQFGHYVLLDDQMAKIATLQSAGSEKEVFAKYLGRKVQVRGTKSSEPKGVFTVTGIEQVADNCGAAK